MTNLLENTMLQIAKQGYLVSVDDNENSCDTTIYTISKQGRYLDIEFGSSLYNDFNAKTSTYMSCDAINARCAYLKSLVSECQTEEELALQLKNELNQSWGYDEFA